MFEDAIAEYKKKLKPRQLTEKEREHEKLGQHIVSYFVMVALSAVLLILMWYIVKIDLARSFFFAVMIALVITEYMDRHYFSYKSVEESIYNSFIFALILGIIYVLMEYFNIFAALNEIAGGILFNM